MSSGCAPPCDNTSLRLQSAGTPRFISEKPWGEGECPETLPRFYSGLRQEAVTNAITHGHATRVDVGLRASKEEVRLTVRNNGKGFNPSEQRTQATSQIGLRVMHEMAVSAGGTFTLDSGRGKRTTVRMRLPLSRKPQINTDEHRF